MRRHFPPEFLNRLDEILVFRSLAREDMAAILDIQLKPLVLKLAARGIQLHVDESARATLAQIGFDPIYGARPLKKALKRELVDRVARMILEGSVGDGSALHASGQGANIDVKVGKSAENAKQK